MKMKFLRTGAFILICVGVVGALYALTKKLLGDREAAMSFHQRPTRYVQTPPSGYRTAKTYNSKDLDKAHKDGDQTSPTTTAPNMAANDAIQRNLRTLDEINRINQMNQRLMEEQERMRRQTKN